MLNIIYGEIEKDNYIFDPDTFFNHQSEDAWLEDEFTKEMVKDVDQSEIIGPHLVQSPFLGAIPPEKLSGGVKTLILIANDNEHIYNASACGDNCAKWLLKIGDNKDVTIRLGYLMNFGKGPFQIHIVNTNKTVNNLEELDDEVIDNGLLQQVTK